jgi:putative Mn2+ efflux pump MntP
MSLFDMIVIGICLAMDASAVSCVNAMASTKLKLAIATITALAFGFFQGLMPVIGYFAGSVFTDAFSSLTHWIAFGLLALVGISMIRESRQSEEEKTCPIFSLRLLFVQSVATSLDALAVGVSFAVVKANIFLAAAVIAITTTLISFIAYLVGYRFGDFFAGKAEFAGGVILILIGLKMVVF